MARNSLGRPKPNPQLDSIYAYEERERDGIDGVSYVMGSADHGYGYVDGFRFGITSTGHKHKESALGKYARTGKR
jgi:hypothetical protein